MKKKYIYTSEDVFKQVAFLCYQPNEHLRALYLTIDNELIHSHTVSSGTTHDVSFLAKNVFRMAIICNAAGIILVHNHPSGSVEPSKEDIRVTKRLIQTGKVVGIQIIDHVIVTKNQFKSILSHKS